MIWDKPSNHCQTCTCREADRPEFTGFELTALVAYFAYMKQKAEACLSYSDLDPNFHPYNQVKRQKTEKARAREELDGVMALAEDIRDAYTPQSRQSYLYLPTFNRKDTK